MIINHNISALNTYRQMGVNQNEATGSMEKLSSGLRINKAGDDAAGLSISEKMRGQIRGLDQASRNAQDGVSLIQTGEGALSETQSILQRMRELSVQSANDTNTTQDRKSIQDEVDQLTKEIDRISETTQFNGKNLLDGSMGKSVNTSVANVNTSNVLTDAGNSSAGIATTTLLTDLQDSNGNSLGVAIGDKVDVSYVINGTTKTDTITISSTSAVSDLYGGSNLSTDGAGSGTGVAGGKIDVEATTAGFNSSINGLTLTVKDSTGSIKSAATNALSSFSETTSAANARTEGSATLQVGANAGQSLQLSIENTSTASLGVKNLQVNTSSQANVAIKVIDNAIEKVSSERSKMGSYQNRLEHTINNLNTSSENLTAAESRIRDVDMAKEMMTMTKENIKAQAAQAMLAQANQAPQQVLQLLR
ncbi:flagellin [Pseudalkalibacillus sp. NRS-1564]|uniref:flagellin N-terminal helical domain-containing protein n=1 Tax=Pseudalkalibacillus sp. NRS-1564 TaxID=3233900 RepID=UPI003D2AF229